MKTKEFKLGQILSITHGRLMCDIGEIYKILNFMTNANLFVNQLSRAAKECKPWLFRQYPQLEKISLDDVNKDNWREILSSLENQYGSIFVVEQIPQGERLYL